MMVNAEATDKAECHVSVAVTNKEGKIMQMLLMISLLVSSALVFADKPEWAGKGKPTDEQKAAHKAAMQAKAVESDDDAEDKVEKAREKIQEAKEHEEGNAKHDKAKKKSKKKDDKDEMDQQDSDGDLLEEGKKQKSLEDQKELDKGSEKGQEARADRKKWWQFWEE